MIANQKASSHEQVKAILAEYKELILKLKDELDKERAVVDYFEDESNWISHTKEVADQTVYYFKSVIDMRKVAFKRQMERRKNL